MATATLAALYIVKNELKWSYVISCIEYSSENKDRLSKTLISHETKKIGNKSGYFLDAQ